MTSFDFAYYKPDTLDEAMDCYIKLTSNHQTVLYYGGGTEIISMARAESIKFDAVIDLKAIPECNALTINDNDLIIGALVTLTNIAESSCFPLLSKTAARIADHTIQGKITLGGNLAGTIIYREAAMPLMITDSRLKIMTRNGLCERPFLEAFKGRLMLDEGDFLVQVLINKNDINLPYNHVKRTKIDKIDYPLVSMAANMKNDRISAAVSGACKEPILLSADVLNNTTINVDERITEIISQINDLILCDIHGSKEYRIFVLSNILQEMFENLQGNVY